jgi:hypothetical protein
MADVHVLPGVFREDLVEDGAPEIALKGAMNANLRQVAIVGRDMAGDICVFGSVPDADRMIGLFMRGVSFLSIGPQVELEPGSDETA